MTSEGRQQIERLYQPALEEPQDRGDSFLAAACRDDEELRLEVESLLAQSPSARAPSGETEWETAAGP